MVQNVAKACPHKPITTLTRWFGSTVIDKGPANWRTRFNASAQSNPGSEFPISGNQANPCIWMFDIVQNGALFYFHTVGLGWRIYRLVFHRLLNTSPCYSTLPPTHSYVTDVPAWLFTAETSRNCRIAKWFCEIELLNQHSSWWLANGASK